MWSMRRTHLQARCSDFRRQTVGVLDFDHSVGDNCIPLTHTSMLQAQQKRLGSRNSVYSHRLCTFRSHLSLSLSLSLMEEEWDGERKRGMVCDDIQSNSQHPAGSQRLSSIIKTETDSEICLFPLNEIWIHICCGVILLLIYYHSLVSLLFWIYFYISSYFQVYVFHLIFIFDLIFF